MSIIFSLLFAGIGLLLIFLGFRERGIVRQLREQGMNAQATITSVKRKVDFDEDSSGRSIRKVTYEASYTFQAMDGSTHSGRTTSAEHEPRPMETATFEVLYMLDDPSRHRKAEDVEGGMTPYVLMGVGGIFFAVGLFIAVSSLM